MLKYFQNILPVFLLLFLGSCATLSKTDCQTGDWTAIGYRDGQRGYLKGRVLEHEKACGKHGINVDSTLYERGRREGLSVFCQPANGYQLGLDADDYRGQCPRHEERDFLAEYRRGLARNRIRTRQDLSRHQNQLGEKKRILRRTRDEGAIKKLNRDIDNLQNEIQRLRTKLDKVRGLEMKWR